MVNIETRPVEAEQMIARSVDGKNIKPRVLVINDTQEILELFREILEEEGFEVILSSFNIQEVDDIREIAPDLVILDFLVGGEAQGWQLLQKLRMTRATETLPIVVCTAAIQLARELEGHLKAKNVGLVLKPFDIDDLVSAVQIAMQPDGVAAVRNGDS